MSSSDAIGGYFELELPGGKEFYSNLTKVNSGRNALEYILLAQGYKKVYVPYFTCDVVLEPFHKHEISYEFYHIDKQLEIQDIPLLGNDEAVLYTNYFGLKSSYVHELSSRVPRLIIDNAQAFYSSPLKGVDTFYSPRKFFGLPDGGYVSTAASLDLVLQKDRSAKRCSHLLLRLDEGAEAGFNDYRENDKSLSNLPIMQMSSLTQSLLEGIEYDFIRGRRTENFMLLHERLKSFNQLEWIDGAIIDGPMVYPFYDSSGGLRQWLIGKKIFTATHWPNVLIDNEEDSLEYRLAVNVVNLPIDQRYGKDSIGRIINYVLEYYGIQN
ncbi:hypothetical protein [Pontibacter indicus]|uniref:dTDP-4-amino-4,6-dideoxygalactose transaminase n=1 Tax=Pontibacter indicus TaxID=1317125 RepID=A0A1R3XS21_9BACT|nr:hypothetical protein [Pontibacter indicus]SIT93822.1 hypothetical protein SAMN05444128_3234 [Pontibacter indicus]